MIINYQSIRLDGSDFIHLPEDQRPCAHHIHAVDTGGNQYFFIADEGGNPFWLHAKMRNGNEYTPHAELSDGENVGTDEQPIFFYDGLWPEIDAEDAPIILAALKKVKETPPQWRRAETVTVTA